MQAVGIGQKALALKAGLNETYVRDILRGKSRNPKHAHLAAIANALDCSILDLVDPGRSNGTPQIGEVIQSADEVTVLRLWRYLTDAGKWQAIRAMTEAARRAAPPANGTEGNDTPG